MRGIRGSLLSIVIVVSFYQPTVANEELAQLAAEDLSQAVLINKNEAADATEVLSRYMSNPTVSELYREIQKQHLATDIELQMESVFETNPILDSIKDQVQAAVNEQVRKGVSYALLQMTQINRESDPKFAKLFEEAARELGFNAKQIKEANLFEAMGPINAHTFSASKDQIAMVVFNGLVTSTTKAQLKGVLGHELGHILSGHIVLGALNASMLMQLSEFFVMNSKILDSDFASLSPSDRALLETLSKPLDLEMSENAHVKHMHTQSRATFIMALKASTEIMEHLKKNSPDELKLMLRDYLGNIVDCLKRMEVPKETAGLFTNMLRNIDDFANYKVSPEHFAKAAQTWSAALQRNFEQTADYYGFTLSGIRAAGMDMVFSGANGKELKQKNFTRYLNAIHNQLEKFYNQMGLDEAERAEILGSPGLSHPFSNIRVDNLVTLARSVDFIAMRNPILKLVVLHDGLALSVKQAKAHAKERQKWLEENRAKLGEEEFQKFNEMVQESFSKEAQREAGLKLTAQALRLDIGRLLKKSQFGQVNPRLKSVLDYYLALKFVATTELAKLAPEQAKEAQKQFPKTSDVIKDIKKAFSKDKKLMSIVAVLENADATADEVRDTRIYLHEWSMVIKGGKRKGQTTTMTSAHRQTQIEEEPAIREKTPEIGPRFKKEIPSVEDKADCAKVLDALSG